MMTQEEGILPPTLLHSRLDRRPPTVTYIAFRSLESHNLGHPAVPSPVVPCPRQLRRALGCPLSRYLSCPQPCTLGRCAVLSPLVPCCRPSVTAVQFHAMREWEVLALIINELDEEATFTGLSLLLEGRWLSCLVDIACRDIVLEGPPERRLSLHLP